MLNRIKSAIGLGSVVDYRKLKEQKAIILDVRGRGEFQSGHYKKAINIPLDQLDSGIEKLKKENRPIITCCVSGARSGSAKRMLELAGIEQVYNGGNWSSLGKAFEEA